MRKLLLFTVYFAITVMVIYLLPSCSTAKITHSKVIAKYYDSTLKAPVVKKVIHDGKTRKDTTMVFYQDAHVNILHNGKYVEQTNMWCGNVNVGTKVGDTVSVIIPTGTLKRAIIVSLQ